MQFYAQYNFNMTALLEYIDLHNILQIISLYLCQTELSKTIKII